VKLDSFGGRSALVTGAASGIGLAVATHLGNRGATFLLNDLAGDALHRAVGIVPNATGIAADLSTRSGALELADATKGVDILVNNAGLQHVSPIEDFDPNRWDLMLAIMLTARFLLIRGIDTGMYERGFGRIVNISSVHGLVASPLKSAYVSSKHGLIGLTKTVALEAAQRAVDVTCNAVCPSYVRTPLVEQQLADQARIHGLSEPEVLEKVLLTNNAVRRLIEPEDVARAVAYLCAPESWSMTGTVMTLDAGWLAHLLPSTVGTD
jgi:3-hydroxybutyrate dehydrogenase